ncbi:hypothetical protein AABV68_001294 [Enterobacter ludwigii]
MLQQIWESAEDWFY